MHVLWTVACIVVSFAIIERARRLYLAHYADPLAAPLQAVGVMAIAVTVMGLITLAVKG
jgi:hypothetical protein